MAEEIDVVESLDIAEFTAMRSEIQKNFEQQFQLISLTIVAAGTLLSVGIQPKVNPDTLLIFPILSLFLAAKCRQLSFLIAVKGFYVRYELEERNKNGGFEQYLEAKKYLNKVDSDPIINRGVFFITQISCILLYITRSNLLNINLANPSTTDIETLTVFSLAVLAVLFTLWLTRSQSSTLKALEKEYKLARQAQAQARQN